jgi:N-acyl-D-aspartate/D-glutamate deacylase
MEQMVSSGCGPPGIQSQCAIEFSFCYEVRFRDRENVVLDLLIRGGELVDGTGGTRRRADVAVEHGRIVEIGSVHDRARRVVDVEGHVVAPGFIDLHTHYDAQAFWDPTLSPSPLHGFTTVFAGNCGFSTAPLTGDSGPYVKRMLARVEGIPLESLDEGAPWDWSSTADYFDRLDGHLAINAGFMVGHSTIRRAVMGEAANRRRATPQELESMQLLLRAGLAAGGMGFSSSWATAHNDHEGNPVPSRVAEAAEMIALAGVCREFDGTSLEYTPTLPPVPPSPFPDKEVTVMAAMSRAAGRPLNWQIIRVDDQTVTQVEARLAGIEATSREQGGRIVGLVMPEPFSLALTFRTGVVLNTFVGWQVPLSLPHADKCRVLSDPAERKRLEALAAGDPIRKAYAAWADYAITEAFSRETKRYEGRTVGDIAAETGKDPFSALMDIVVADDLRTYFAYPTPEPTHADWEARARICRDPRVLIGGSDAGAHVDILGTHNYSTNIFANMVRGSEVMTLEEAVHLLTGAPASLYGLRDRGELRAGAAADIVVFDEGVIGNRPPVTRFDLPAGAGRLYSEAVGIDHVIVNGDEVVRNGTFTDNRPGLVLRSGRDSHGPSFGM